jgi:hypothetical protein
MTSEPLFKRSWGESTVMTWRGWVLTLMRYMG